MFEIKLQAIRLPFKGGFYHEEKRITQTLEFDIRLIVASGEFRRSGELSDTVDYSTIVPILKEVLQSESTLLESICVRGGELILSKFDLVEEAEVTVRKWPQLGCPNKGVEVSYVATRT